MIFGGRSQEHDVSVITGVLTLNSLDKTIFSPIPVYVDKDGVWYTGEGLNNIANFKSDKLKRLKRVALFPGDDRLYEVEKRVKPIAKIACAVNCMHGRNGEDGTVSAVFKLSAVPLASPDVFPSAMSMDKDVCKLCLKAMGIPTVDGVTIERSTYFADVKGKIKRLEKLGYPLIVKPCSSGSSIGVSVAKDGEQLEAALAKAFTFDVKTLVEKFVDGFHDVNCACFKADGVTYASELEMPFGGEFLSFSDKYSGSKGGGRRVFPAKLDGSLTEKIRATTIAVYERFQFNGMVRFDYLVKGEEYYLNEINSVPGSLAYYLFCDKLSDFTRLLTKLIVDGQRYSREYFNTQFAFSSSVLQLDGIGVKK